MDIRKQIDKFCTRQLPRLENLHDYYLGKHRILRVQKADNKPNNRLVTNYARDIVLNTTGYFMGNPVVYECEDESLKQDITDITAYNDDDAHNFSLSLDISTYGLAYELIYFDSDKKIRYAKLSPLNTFISYNNDIERTINYAVYFYDIEDEETEKVTRYANVYDDKCITAYRIDTVCTLLSKEPHYCGQVPVNIYVNNEYKQGDFEPVITLIDAYNTMQSESVNDFQAFADAYLHLRGAKINEEDAEEIREKRIIETDENGEINWVVKNVPDGYIENIKNRLNKDIYTTSQTINFADENFNNNDSGRALKHKLLQFENRVANTQRYYEKSLARRWEIICDMLNLLGRNYDFTSIKFVFNRNLPADLTEISTMIAQLAGVVSKRTLLAQLPFVSDVDAELEELKKESPETELFNGEGVSYE